MNKSEIEAKKESTWNKLKTLPNFLITDDGLNWKDSKSVTVFHELMQQRDPSITREQAIEELHRQRKEKADIMKRKLEQLSSDNSIPLKSGFIGKGGAKSGRGRKTTMRRRRSSLKRGRKLTVKKRSKRRSTKRRRSMRSTKRRRTMRH